MRPWQSLPIRLRLTVFYGVVLALTLTAFGGLVYLLFERNLMAQLDQRIADRAEEVQRSVREDAAQAIRLQGTRLLVRRQFIVPRVNAFASAYTFVQVARIDGEIVDWSENLGNQRIPVDATDLAAARVGQPLYETLTIGADHLRVFELPLVIEENPLGLIQVAESLGPVDDSLARLRLTLLVTGGLSVIFSVLIGLGLARAALQPIHRIASTAAEIGGSRDFSRRVEYEGPRDEVGQLAATFNAMLARLQDAFGEVKTASERLAAMLAAQRRFVADASHELRTPLTTIRGNASLLKRSDLTSDDREEAVEQILSESERMSRLVHDLLTLARADSGQHLQQRESVPIGTLVEDVARQATLLSDHHEICLGPVVNETVMGDRDYLRQLLLILVDNAIKYTPPGGRVTLCTARQNGVVSVTVEDSGIGIAPEDLPYVFERFYRADRARQAGGTGLGLAIAKWIADEHSGAISVRSTPGEGSAFTVTLPKTVTGDGARVTGDR